MNSIIYFLSSYMHAYQISISIFLDLLQRCLVYEILMTSLVCPTQASILQRLEEIN